MFFSDREVSQTRTLLPLLLAAAFLLASNGLQTTMLALRGISSGFPDAVIGLLLSAYFAGFITGCRYAPRLIQNVGHIRAFTAFASIASAAALAHSLVTVPWAWLLLRVVTGFCFAALQIILESWLNEISTNESRGRILSTYRITDFSSVTVAQLAVGLFEPTDFPPFIVMSIGLSIALVPIALTRVAAPAPPASAKLNVRKLFRVSPLAAVGAFVVGVSSAAYWSLSPVFLTAAGFTKETVGAFIAAIIFGGAIGQWPIGALSDKFDRRRVIIAVSMGTVITALGIPAVAELGRGPLLIAGFAFGIFALPGFGLAVAHANDHAEQGEALSVNGGLLMLFGAASVIGPIIAPPIMATFGNSALFFLVASVYALLVAFGLYRMTARAAPEVQEPYVPVPRSSPAIFELDPRIDDTADEETEEDRDDQGAEAGGQSSATAP